LSEQSEEQQETGEFSQMMGSYSDTSKTVLRPVWVSSAMKLVDGLRTRFEHFRQGSNSGDQQPPPWMELIANGSLKYFLLFLNGYFLGIIVGILFLL